MTKFRTSRRLSAAPTIGALLLTMLAAGAGPATAWENPGGSTTRVFPDMSQAAAEAWYFGQVEGNGTEAGEPEICVPFDTAFTAAPTYNINGQVPAGAMSQISTGDTVRFDVLDSSCAQALGITKIVVLFPTLQTLTADGRSIVMESTAPSHYNCDDPEHLAAWGCPAYAGGSYVLGLLPTGDWAQINLDWWAPGILPGGGTIDPGVPPVVEEVDSPLVAPTVIDHAVTVPVGTAVDLDLLDGSSLGGATEWVAVEVGSADGSLGLVQGELGAVTMLPTSPGVYTVAYRAVAWSETAGVDGHPTADHTMTVTVVEADVVTPEPEVPVVEPVVPAVEPEVTPVQEITVPESEVVVTPTPVATPEAPTATPEVRIETGLAEPDAAKADHAQLGALAGLLAAAIAGLTVAGAARGRRREQ